MKINQVEELVGITKKNIRFYEEQGLLNPDRDPENGYGSSAVMQSAAEIIAFGTAVKFVNK